MVFRIGTHPSGPSRVKDFSDLLSDWIEANPAVVGAVPSDYKNSEIPFLFKVLSVNTALSIQV
jgi:mannose-6-phosphate isomerase